MTEIFNTRNSCQKTLQKNRAHRYKWVPWERSWGLGVHELGAQPGMINKWAGLGLCGRKFKTRPGQARIYWPLVKCGLAQKNIKRNEKVQEMPVLARLGLAWLTKWAGYGLECFIPAWAWPNPFKVGLVLNMPRPGSTQTMNTWVHNSVFIFYLLNLFPNQQIKWN